MFETYVTYVSYIMETLLHLLEWLVVRVVEAGSVYHLITTSVDIALRIGWHLVRYTVRDDARIGHKRYHRVLTAYATATDHWQQEGTSCSFEKGRPDRFCAYKHARTANCAVQDCLQ